MKMLRVLAFCVFYVTACISSSAQTPVPLNEPDYNKPKIFSDLPQQMILLTLEANHLFDLQAGDAVNAQISQQFNINGIVISNGGSKTVRTIIIKIPSRNNAILTLTRNISDNGVTVFGGRMMSRNNGDAYEIQKDNDRFVFNKINLYDLISE